MWIVLQGGHFFRLSLTLTSSYLRTFSMIPGGGATCYVGVPGDVPFSWVYLLPENPKQDFLPKNSKVGYQF